MTKYGKLISISFKENTVYRSKVVLYVIGGFIQVFMYYYIWNAVFKSGEDLIGGYTKLEFLTYIIISFSLLGLMPNSVANELSKSVRTGDIVSLMTKPVSVDYYYLFYSLGDSIITGIFMGIPVFLIGYFYVGIMMPFSILPFVISVILGFIVVFYLNFIIGQLSFFTTSVVGIVIAYQSIAMFLSGSIVPLSLLPEGIRAFIELLPFKCSFSVPLNIYLGKIIGGELVYNIILQLVWVFVLKYLSDKLYKVGFQRNSILGG